MEEGKQICFLRCPDPTCMYLEFPGCATHKMLYNKPTYIVSEQGNKKTKKKLDHVSCVRCVDSGTHNSTPFSEACRRCERAKAKPFLFYVRDSLPGNILQQINNIPPSALPPPPVVNEDDDVAEPMASFHTAVLVCRKCKAAEFPTGAEGKEKSGSGKGWLMLWKNGRIVCPVTNKTFIASDYFKFVHSPTSTKCSGQDVISLPVQLDREEAKYIFDSYRLTPSLEADKRAADERFKLDSIAETTATGIKMASLLESTKLYDVTFRVGDQKFPAHKTVLATRSRVFARMMYGQYAERDQSVIDLAEISAGNFQSLLRFFYSNHIELTVENVMDIVHLADLFEVEPLQQLCRAFMDVNLNVQTACGLFLSSKYVHGLEFLLKHGDEVIQTTDFINSFDEEAVLTICSNDQLAVDEYELLEAIVKWARARCEQSLPPLEPTPANLKAMMGNVLECVRLPLLSARDIAQSDNLHLLLNNQQLRELYVWAGFQEMPETEREALGLDEKQFRPKSFNFTPRAVGGGIQTPYFKWDANWGPSEVQILNDGRTASFPHSCKQQMYRRGDVLWKNGLIYWEVLLDKTPGCYMAFGLVTPEFTPGPTTVGQNDQSWAVRLYAGGSDARFSGTFHNNVQKSFHNQWTMGDRVGMLVDLSKTGSMVIFRNGDVVGEAFTNLKGKSVYPVINLCHSSQATVQKVRANKGNRTGSESIADGLIFTRET